MWDGPYGEWGSRKYLLSSLDQSLKRLGLDYVDIFYSHRFDPDTPLEETMGALDTAVRSGRALYAGISSYNSEKTRASRGDPQRPRHPARHPPAELQHDQPLGRAGRPQGHARRPRRRLDRLHPARPGHADRQVPRGHPRRQPRRPGQVPAPGVPQRPRHRQHPQAQRHRRSPRPDPRPDGDRLGAARRRHHLRPDRRLPPLSGRGLRRRGEEPRLHRGRARRDRPLGQRGGHQPLGKSSEGR